MRNTSIIALREWRERLRSRSFLVLALVGPIVVLGLIYLLFALGGKNQTHWRVLIADPAAIMDNKIMAKEDVHITYDFINDYIEHEDFAIGKRFQSYDALLEVNEKVLNNKTGFLFYREKPSFLISTRVQYQFERRLEEVMVSEFSDLSVSKFRELKQPINLAFRNVYDPRDEASDLSGWVGFFFGAVILLFIFTFGMTILRSVSREKSNRIVEVILASVKPRELMFGKVLGIGLAAFIQFAIWVGLIALGLYAMRETLFPDLLDASKWDLQQMTEAYKNEALQQGGFRSKAYNEFVELVYERIQFGSMLGFFLLFFVLGYLFYGSFFVALGASAGSESDGQQFVFPLFGLLLLSLYSGYYGMYYPTSTLATWFSFLPFTSPVSCMVKLAQGYPEGTSYQLLFSIVFLLLSTLLTLWLAGRVYKNGILHQGHRLSLFQLIQWLRKSN